MTSRICDGRMPIIIIMRRDRQDYRERSREKKRRPAEEHSGPPPRRDPRPRDDMGRKGPDIKRSQVCPFLVRVFYAINDVNQLTQKSNLPLDREIRLYLWMNVTLKQIVQLTRAHLPSVRTKQRFVLSRIECIDERLQRHTMGTVMVHKRGEAGEESSLEEHGFVIGDCIDISINYK